MKYKLAPTKQFTKMLKAQTPGLKKQLKKTLKHLQENPAHPSLRSKKYQSIEGVWESSICSVSRPFGVKRVKTA